MDERESIMDMTRNEVLELYDNVHAVKAMLKDRYFGSINKWGVACQNAVGGNISSMPLKGRLFAAGVCYEDLILGAKGNREAHGVEVSDLSASEADGEEMSAATSDEDGGATSEEY